MTNNRRTIRYFHYTPRTSLVKILASGVINTAAERLPPNERPVVWCTCKPDWEETANKMISDPRTGGFLIGTRETTRILGGGLFRIEISAAALPLDWDLFVRQSGITTSRAKSLKRVALRQSSNPVDWRMSFEPIPREHWISIEEWTEAGWIPSQIDSPVEPSWKQRLRAITVGDA